MCAFWYLYSIQCTELSKTNVLSSISTNFGCFFLMAYNKIIIFYGSSLSQAHLSIYEQIVDLHRFLHAGSPIIWIALFFLHTGKCFIIYEVCHGVPLLFSHMLTTAQWNSSWLKMFHAYYNITFPYHIRMQHESISEQMLKIQGKSKRRMLNLAPWIFEIDGAGED